MFLPRPKFKFSHTWTIAAIATILVACGWTAALWVFPVSGLSVSSPAKHKPFLELQKPADYADAIRDQSVLMDPAPLFLPTKWSTAGARHVISGKLGATELSDAFPPQIEIEAGMIDPRGKDETTPITAISSKYDDTGPILKMGQTGNSMKNFVFSPRGANYEVLDDRSGKKLLEGNIAAQVTEAGDLLWQPAEFWVRIVPEGAFGNPLLAGSSGNDALDSALRKIIASLDRLSSLPPGYYKVIVGP